MSSLSKVHYKIVMYHHHYLFECPLPRCSRTKQKKKCLVNWQKSNEDYASICVICVTVWKIEWIIQWASFPMEVTLCLSFLSSEWIREMVRYVSPSTDTWYPVSFPLLYFFSVTFYTYLCAKNVVFPSKTCFYIPVMARLSPQHKMSLLLLPAIPFPYLPR